MIIHSPLLDRPLFSRRSFLESAATGVAGLLLARSGLGSTRAPSDKLTVACIGVGSQGLRVMMDLLRLPEVQIVAVCDVNRQSSNYLDWGPNELRNKVRLLLQDPGWGASFPGPTAGREVAKAIVNAFYSKTTKASYRSCTEYEDFRELLAKEKDLDAVVVSPPDHWHAIIAIAAMRAGKHVYCQKPMAHSVFEARQMVEVAKSAQRANQVSIFNSSTPESKRVIETVQSGVLGPVRKVDIWTRRPAAFWKQGLVTPTTVDPVPAGLNWDFWLGPAPNRPYNHIYQPFVWRAWYDYGCGAIGDMGEYGFDTIVRALHLGSADQIYASSTEQFPDCYPVASVIHFHFPARGENPPVDLTWYDGGLKPPRPPELAADANMSIQDEGVLYTGDHGKLLTGFMTGNPRLLSPDGTLSTIVAMADTRTPFLPDHPEWGASYTAADSAHYREWIQACRGEAPAHANFAFEAPIVESLMLGNIALRTQESLVWDAEGFQLTRGSSEARALLKPTYREPWAKFAQG